MIRLLGLAVMVLGFVCRINGLVVVLAAGLTSGLVAGLTPVQVLAEFGRLFVATRYLTLPLFLMLPVIGLLERYGLREQASNWIRRLGGATAGRVLLGYTAFRQITIAFGIQVGGQAGPVRPLVVPMAEGAARAQLGTDLLEPRAVQTIRAHAAAADNIGNFFGEDLFIAIGAILLMKGFFVEAGIEVSTWSLALWGAPTAVVAFGAMTWKTRRLDRMLAKLRHGPAAPPPAQ
jgi:uncharacterized membrane protein